MKYTGITLFPQDAATILTILNDEADRRKALYEKAIGTDTEKDAERLYCDCIRAYTELDVQIQGARRRRDMTCEIKSLEQS